MNPDSPFYRWPRGSFVRQQAELAVRWRQLGRAVAVAILESRLGRRIFPRSV